MQRCLPGFSFRPSVSAPPFLFSCHRSCLLLLIPQIKGVTKSEEGPGFMALSSTLVGIPDRGLISGEIESDTEIMQIGGGLFVCPSHLVGLCLDLSLARSAPGLICFPLCSPAPARLSWLAMTGIHPPKPELESLLAAASLLAVWAGCRRSCMTGPSRAPCPSALSAVLWEFSWLFCLCWCCMDLSLPSCWSEPSPLRALQQPNACGLQQLSRPPGAGHSALHSVLCPHPVIP